MTGQTIGLQGVCKQCGSTQAWTLIGGEVYTSCDAGCLPLPLENLAPPRDSPELIKPTELVHISEHLRDGRRGR